MHQNRRGVFRRLVLVGLLCLPLTAQETGRYFAAIWPEGCIRLPRESCWTYAYLPDGWTVTKATSGPSWAYRLIVPPATNPGTALLTQVEVTDIPCDVPNVLQAKDNWLSICVEAPPEISATPRYVRVRIPYVVIQ